MAWQGSTAGERTSTTAWRKLRLAVLDRDEHTCYVCGGPANQVDHRTAVASGGTDAHANLAAICRPCHASKSGREGGQASAKAPHPGPRRPPERHPGLRP